MIISLFLFINPKKNATRNTPKINHGEIGTSKRIIPKILKKNFLKNKARSGRLKLYIGCTDPDASNYCEKCDILDLGECEY